MKQISIVFFAVFLLLTTQGFSQSLKEKKSGRFKKAFCLFGRGNSSSCQWFGF